MSKNNGQQPFLRWADVLKFWGILAIVWGHTLSRGAVHQYLYSFHVPLFFFVIGLYFKASQVSFCRFCKKKAISLLLPYLAIAVLSVLIFAVLGELASSALGYDGVDFSLRTNLLEILTGQCRANRPLWFLPCMFVFYILCYGLTKLAEKRTGSIRAAIYMLAIAGSVALCGINSAFFHISGLFWKADVSVFMLSFFSLAAIIKPILAKPKANWVCALLAFFLFLLGGYLAFRNSLVGYLSNSYGDVLLFYLSATCTVLALCFVSILLSQVNIQTVTRAMVYVGKRTLPILLMHKFPILFFQVLFPWTKQPLKNNDPYVGLVVAIVSIGACLIAERIWQNLSNMVTKARRNQ